MNNKQNIIPATIGIYYLFSIMEYEGIPILFVASNDYNEFFLCDCVEFRHFQRWTISKISLHILELVITQKITVFEALKEDEGLKIIVTYYYDSRKVTQEKIAFSAIQQDDLPEQDAYACMISHDAYDNLRLLRLLINAPENNENRHFSNMQTETVSYEHHYIVQEKEDTKFYSNNINLASIALVA